MANLMLTKRCNLHCTYCFANEFVNHQTDDMSLDNFDACLKFLSSDPSERVGLIGGEPTLHPNFKSILARLINSPFQSVCVFTNGILLDRYFTELRNSRFQILINLNEPSQIGQSIYDHIMDNMDQMINSLYMAEQTGIGINLYKPDMDYGYLLDAIRRFHLKKVRVSISVPNMESGKRIDPLKHFNSMRPLVLRFLRDILEVGAAPNFDCNYIPLCLMREEDNSWLNRYSDILKRSNLLRPSAICSPVIDILPDLNAVRCFGMSRFYKTNIRQFQNSKELKRHFLLEVDACAYPIIPSESCLGCHDYISGNCSCGCYAYREEGMQKLKEITAQLFGGVHK